MGLRRVPREPLAAVRERRRPVDGLGAAAPDEARLRRVCAPLGIHAKHGTECAVSVALAGRGVHLKAEDAFRNLTLVRPPVEVSSPRRLNLRPPVEVSSPRRRLKSCADSATFDPEHSCWEIHSCGLLKKEASIVCHGAGGEKLCCASKQEHCCIYDEKPIKALFYSTLVVVIILGLFLILQCWRWSRPEPSPLRASPSAAPPPPEPEPIAQAEVVPYPNR